MTSSRRHPPPWLFLFSGTAYGVPGAFVSQMMPFFSRKSGIELGDIGWFVTLLFVPSLLQPLYAPIVDIGPPRKVWLVILSALAGAALACAFAFPPPEHITAFLAFGFVAQTLSALISACNGGLLAVTMPDELRGRASAWLNVGNLSGGGIAGAAAIWLLGSGVEPMWVGLIVAALMFVPSLAILFANEPKNDNIRSLGDVFGQTLRDVAAVLFSKKGLTGIALCISPVGTAAMTQYFSGIGKDYTASDDRVAFVSGGASVVVTAIGALAGGYLCDRYNRRALYLLSGVLTAVCGVVVAALPHSPMTYTYGATMYNLITGLCYAAFTATVLETIGEGGKAAGTQYALFVSAGNAAIAYVTLIDTRFKHELGTSWWRLSYGIDDVWHVDALLNAVGVVVLGLAFWKLGAFGKRRVSPAVAKVES
jgi:MFS transporter, PAT family, beta-lactamase induction signal transducer AmpG